MEMVNQVLERDDICCSRLINHVQMHPVMLLGGIYVVHGLEKNSDGSDILIRISTNHQDRIYRSY